MSARADRCKGMGKIATAFLATASVHSAPRGRAWLGIVPRHSDCEGGSPRIEIDTTTKEDQIEQ